MSIVTVHNRTMFKNQAVPAVIARRQRKEAKEAALQAAYAAVDKRDGGKCWVTGKATQVGAPDQSVRRVHHHLRGRNAAPDRVNDENNIITLTWEAHKLIHNGWIAVEGDDARKPVRFHWTSLATVRPFRIKSRRKSQQRDS